jgi:hypothetical protein
MLQSGSETSEPRLPTKGNSFAMRPAPTTEDAAHLRAAEAARVLRPESDDDLCGRDDLRGVHLVNPEAIDSAAPGDTHRSNLG